MLEALKQRLAVAVCVMFAAFFPVGAIAGEPIRIMPLGDSITAGTGSTNNNGYRKPLYLDLISADYEVDFVGSTNAYNWQTISNPLSIQWLSSVNIAIGGGSDGVYLRSVEAYLENFEITGAKLLDWPPKTDLGYNGYIELDDLVELCRH